jgi:DNA-binding helix-hairpin-helix protein with protein kinase domain
MHIFHFQLNLNVLTDAGYRSRLTQSRATKACQRSTVVYIYEAQRWNTKSDKIAKTLKGNYEGNEQTEFL